MCYYTWTWNRVAVCVGKDGGNVPVINDVPTPPAVRRHKYFLEEYLNYRYLQDALL